MSKLFSASEFPPVTLKSLHRHARNNELLCPYAVVDYDRCTDKKVLAKENSWRVGLPAMLNLFVEVLESSGCNVWMACKTSGLSLKEAGFLRARIPKLEEAWLQAVETIVPQLEGAAFKRAVHGVEVPIYQGGQLVGTKIKYSDILLGLLLQGNAPDKYGKSKNAINEATGMESLTDDELDKAIVEKMKRVGLDK